MRANIDSGPTSCRATVNIIKINHPVIPTWHRKNPTRGHSDIFCHFYMQQYRGWSEKLSVYVNRGLLCTPLPFKVLNEGVRVGQQGGWSLWSHTVYFTLSVRARYTFFFTICTCVVRGSCLRARESINLQHINVTICTVHSPRDIFHCSRQVEDLFKPQGTVLNLLVVDHKHHILHIHTRSAMKSTFDDCWHHLKKTLLVFYKTNTAGYLKCIIKCKSITRSSNFTAYLNKEMHVGASLCSKNH